MSSARLASLEAGLDVEVVDSRTLGMALGFGVLAALRWSQAGYDVDAVAEAARATCASSRTAFYVDSLEPLRRGGRIGRAGALFGSALSIKPLLQVDDGVVCDETLRADTEVYAAGDVARWPNPLFGRTMRL